MSRMACLVILGALVWLALPAEANIVPDAMVYFNIRPQGEPEQLCQTDIEDCSQMVASTPAEGRMEFQLFIDPQKWVHGQIPVTRFETDLVWPEAWTLVGGDYCRDGFWWFDYWGPNPHHLEVDWPCEPTNGMFLAMSLVFDVQGYGRFEPTGDCRLWLGCSPDNYLVYPTAQFAEAGTDCEYTDQPCATWYFYCVPHWDEELLELSGPEGGSAHAEMGFDTLDLGEPCTGFTAEADLPWISARVENGAHWWEFVLVVDADLAGILSGTYETELQVEREGSVARCIPLTVHVESTGDVADPDGITLPSCRLVSGNPSTGPFILDYDSPAGVPARCGVYDASGREIARIAGEAASGARGTVTWDATDARGDRVRPGVYVIRLEAGGEMQSSRVVVVR